MSDDTTPQELPIPVGTEGNAAERHGTEGNAAGGSGANMAAPGFAEPWHAQLFAITIKLSQAGHFTWAEWTARFGAAQKQASEDGAPSDGSAYYDVWLATLEDLLIERGLADGIGLADLKQAWNDAYLETPHGQPVKLKSGRPAPPRD